MAQPDDKKALAKQPAHYSDLKPGMDPHYSSGPATSGAVPGMTMKQFAGKTRQAAGVMFGKEKAVKGAVDAGWGRVGL